MSSILPDIETIVELHTDSKKVVKAIAEAAMAAAANAFPHCKSEKEMQIALDIHVHYFRNHYNKVIDGLIDAEKERENA